MAELTPLSISLPLGKKTKEVVLPDRDSYEARVKERSFKPDGITKEQIANITDKDRYRPTPGDPHASDQEENDELATESDLETHAGDDDLNYSTNLEEEDEGYDSLQSQFRNVRIRKRQRDDVEDAEDQNEAWQGDGLAHVNGDGKQKARNRHLTDKEHTRQGKKSRTAKTTSVTGNCQDATGNEKKI